jgi:hypothetical protein
MLYPFIDKDIAESVAHCSFEVNPRDLDTLCQRNRPLQRERPKDQVMTWLNLI